MDVKKKNLMNLIKKKNTPNILLHGPYLCGKEELCKYFIDTLYVNQEDRNKYVLLINCLYANGIQNMKQNIKLFAMQIIRKNINLKFKTIVLQYAEHLTNDSQYCLRRTIEQYNHHTRFIILCENKHKLLQPICSRFVQIYVNEQLIKNNFVLYDSFRYNVFTELMKTYKNIIKGHESYSNMFILAKKFYEQKFIALEIIKKFNKEPYYEEKLFLCNQYFKEFRNECLSIFFILNIFRNKFNNQIF